MTNRIKQLIDKISDKINNMYLISPAQNIKRIKTLNGEVMDFSEIPLDDLQRLAVSLHSQSKSADELGIRNYTYCGYPISDCIEATMAEIDKRQTFGLIKEYNDICNRLEEMIETNNIDTKYIETITRYIEGE